MQPLQDLVGDQAEKTEDQNSSDAGEASMNRRRHETSFS